MPANVALRKGLGTAFNVLSRQFMPGVTVKLLKSSDSYRDEYDTALEITTKRFLEFKEDRSIVFLEIAEDTDELTEAMKDATHIEITDANGVISTYVIDTADTIAPLSTDVTWKLRGDLFKRAGIYADL